jgi:hypothetical protein
MTVRFWSVVVKGECSSVRLTEAGAKAVGERLAWDSEANHRSRPARIGYLHQRPHAEEKAQMDQFDAILADVAQRYPATNPGHQPALDEIIHGYGNAPSSAADGEPEASGPKF